MAIVSCQLDEELTYRLDKACEWLRVKRNSVLKTMIKEKVAEIEVVMQAEQASIVGEKPAIVRNLATEVEERFERTKNVERTRDACPLCYAVVVVEDDMRHCSNVECQHYRPEY